VLTLPRDQRIALWEKVVGKVEEYLGSIDDHPVSVASDPSEVWALLKPLDFSVPMAPEDAVELVAEGLWRHQVHTSHARYFGLFNPNPTTMGIAADFLVAAFNPQLAAWGHSPLACEIEQHLVRQLAARFGYDPTRSAGSFTSGGAEANHTGLLAALTRAFPSYARAGAFGLPARPTLYVSEESHHSFAKAARMCGIGDGAVALIPLDRGYVMDTRALAEQVRRDRAEGRAPFLVVATMGTTNAGLVDPIDRIADVAEAESLWLHADAAWGGAAALVPELKPALGGIERADSITFDAHKWLSVPMGAGMFFTRHPEILERTFGVDTQYMPLIGEDRIVEPHRTTMQWSRRFIGLKLFLSLLVAGWEGYEEALRHQTRMGELLREKLSAQAWRIVADTPLPTVCFQDGREGAENTLASLAGIAGRVVNPGRAWISTTRIGQSLPVLRATITNYRTQPPDLDALVADLDAARGE
jgi:glutamate/tyrosine decarboxylase-like PLP-dependent enzyme